MNYYTQGINDEPLPGDAKLQKKLAKLCAPRLPETGVEVGYYRDGGKEGIIIFGEQFFVPENLPEAFLDEVAKVLRRKKMPYLTFSIAYTADRLVPGAIGGNRCIITDDGQVVYRNEENSFSYQRKDGTSMTHRI
jgi:hypothetical protein